MTRLSSASWQPTGEQPVGVAPQPACSSSAAGGRHNLTTSVVPCHVCSGEIAVRIIRAGIELGLETVSRRCAAATLPLRLQLAEEGMSRLSCSLSHSLISLPPQRLQSVLRLNNISVKLWSKMLDMRRAELRAAVACGTVRHMCPGLPSTAASRASWPSSVLCSWPSTARPTACSRTASRRMSRTRSVCLQARPRSASWAASWGSVCLVARPRTALWHARAQLRGTPARSLVARPPSTFWAASCVFLCADGRTGPQAFLPEIACQCPTHAVPAPAGGQRQDDPGPVLPGCGRHCQAGAGAEGGRHPPRVRGFGAAACFLLCPHLGRS